MIGNRIGHYEITARLGEGGMGEVYRARDTRLGRDVAIKQIPPHLLDSPEHVSRFQREARVLAALNHPHIGAIYGLEELEGRHLLVLELIEGVDLAERLSRGALPLEDLLPLARQIAEGVDYAHRQGVIHRDLKPGNVAITADGTAKVLDFGLAKALGPETDGEHGVSAHSRTIVESSTAPNTILGSAAYMSPEQARGKAVDARTDVWAFGCLLMECLSGERLFRGDTASDILAAVLRDEIPWAQLPERTPPALRRLLRRCLERDPARRLASLADACLELDDARDELESGAGTTAIAAPARSPRLRWLPWLLASALGLLAALQFARPTAAPAARPVVRFSVTVDSLHSASSPPQISHDGSKLLYLAGSMLWVRDLDQLEARPVLGSEGASMAFWSPDASMIGFYFGQQMFKIPAGGGTRVAICQTPEVMGEAGRSGWLPDDRIIFATGDGPLYEVSARGGVPRVLLALEPGLDDDFHEPFVLPGDRGVLFTPHYRVSERDAVEWWHDGERRVIWEHPWSNISAPMYSAGHLVFQQYRPDPGIWAVRFALDRMEVTGDPFLVAPGAELGSVSADGTLIYAHSGDNAFQVVRVDLAGKLVGEPLEPRRHADNSTFSPSGTRLVHDHVEGDKGGIVLHDLLRNTQSMVNPRRSAMNAFWIDEDQIGIVEADSSRIVVQELTRGLAQRALLRAPDGYVFQRTTASPSLSPDGRTLLYAMYGVETGADIWLAPLDGSGDPRPILASEDDDEDPQISPDGELLIFTARNQGTAQIYVAAFESSMTEVSRRWQVSTNGGQYPRWSPDGRRIYFQSRNELMAVEVSLDTGIALGEPERLFGLDDAQLALAHGYDVAPDGQSFVMIQSGDPRLGHRELVVVQNWAEEFRER